MTFLLQIDSVSIGKMMFIASFGIPIKFHIGLRLSVIFADTVDYDMYMNIATAIMTVSVSTDKVPGVRENSLWHIPRQAAVPVLQLIHVRPGL